MIGKMRYHRMSNLLYYIFNRVQGSDSGVHHWVTSSGSPAHCSHPVHLESKDGVAQWPMNFEDKKNIVTFNTAE